MRTASGSPTYPFPMTVTFRECSPRACVGDLQVVAASMTVVDLALLLSESGMKLNLIGPSSEDEVELSSELSQRSAVCEDLERSSILLMFSMVATVDERVFMMRITNLALLFYRG